jgi:hypothetical protein
MKRRVTFTILSIALILGLALSGCSLGSVRESIEKRLGRERPGEPVVSMIVEEEFEESLVEEAFGDAVRRTWIDEEWYEEEVDVDTLPVIRTPFVEEELYEEELDVDLADDVRGVIRRETTPRTIVPEVELDEALYEEELGLFERAMVPQILPQKRSSHLDVEETLLLEELEEMGLEMPALRARPPVPREELLDDSELE